DHRHYAGGAPYAAIGRSGSVGGGHAHCGACLYLGDEFPDDYRNTLFMGNIHGNRINNDRFERQGSGFHGHLEPDIVIANDTRFRQTSAKYGPEGAIYFIDWYDKHPCHQTPGELWDRTNGRMYRIEYGDFKSRPANVGAMTDEQLVKLHLEKND